MNSTNTINLDWTKLTRISELTYNDNIISSGVYLWGFTIDNKFIPYYVGIADNISLRIHEHINAIIGGRYTIYHMDSLACFKDFKNDEVQSEMSKGKIYIPDWPFGYKKFIDNHKNLQIHIDFMLESFTFSYATIDRQSFSADDLKEIEKLCINKIGKENLANARAGHSEKFSIVHKNCIDNLGN